MFAEAVERCSRLLRLAAAGTGLDQLDKSAIPVDDVLVLADPFRRRERFGVLAMAVVQQGSEPPEPAEGRAFSTRHRTSQRCFADRLELCVIAAASGQHACRVPERRKSGRLRDHLELIDQRRGGGERPRMDVERGEVVERVGEQVERAGLARQAHAVGRKQVPELVFPKILREAARQPQPAPGHFHHRRARANARSASDSGATDAA